MELGPGRVLGGWHQVTSWIRLHALCALRIDMQVAVAADDARWAATRASTQPLTTLQSIKHSTMSTRGAQGPALRQDALLLAQIAVAKHIGSGWQELEDWRTPTA